jgi:sodium/pantothenate symporter
MVAITWLDVLQGTLMLTVVVGTGLVLVARVGSPVTLMSEATRAAPDLGRVANQSVSVYLGYFVIWASAISVIPHIVMRVYTARDAARARLSLNLAMVFYSIMILAAVLAVVPAGKIQFPALPDADAIFLKVMEAEFPPLFRGVAVAAVLAAVMSTTDALLLACSSAVSHDLLGGWLRARLSERATSWVRVGTTWILGALALYWAYSPPPLITEFYTAAVGLISAGLFVPTVAGLWWKKANRSGGVAALVTGTLVYIIVQSGIVAIPLSPILAALPASALAMWLGGRFGTTESSHRLEQVAELHRE